jgi:hypothetical protein
MCEWNNICGHQLLMDAIAESAQGMRGRAHLGRSGLDPDALYVGCM